MWLTGASFMLALLLASGAWDSPRQGCPQPAVSPNVVFRPPGANVTLRCLERTPPNSTVVHWRFKGLNPRSSLARQVGEGPSLFLPAVQHNDSGQYSCYSGEHRLQFVKLVVEEPLEEPAFTCFRRSMTKDILCEWKPSRPVSPHAKALLLVAEGFMAKNHTKYQCRYYIGSQKFTCRIMPPRSDSSYLQIYMCVLHAAGKTTSQLQFLQISSLLKPDPPVDVAVNMVENAPQKLLVTWRNPPSWGSSFYYLKFQLRYQAENSPTYYQVEIKPGMTSYMIPDAFRGLRHIVQVRGCEEFELGSWSEWSRKSSGTPWTEPIDPELETTSYVSKQFPCEFCFDGTSHLPSSTATPAVEDVAIVPLHTFVLMAFSVTVGFVLVIGIILRYRRRWRPSGEEKQSKVPALSLAPVAPSPPLSASPLLTPPASPLSESSVDSPGILDHNPYDVSNADYFLLPQ
ncbi:hypothetical protein lerEdw1_003044 [Lerista edwardsae]|nr:hypothetical protein lerEdw1_003044 [Lerista edwardsae]